MEAGSGLSSYDSAGGKGGDVVLTGGRLHGESRDEFGGSVRIHGGDAQVASGGSFFLSSGSSQYGSSGSINISSSPSHKTGDISMGSGKAIHGDSGSIVLSTGDALEASGSISISVGTGTNSDGGDVIIAAGSSLGSNSPGSSESSANGDIAVRSRDVMKASSTPSGSILLTTGVADKGSGSGKFCMALIFSEVY